MRIAAMRLMKEVPDMKAQLDEGDLNLTHLSLASRLFNKKEDEYRLPEKKREFLESFVGKSKMKCLRIVATICPEVLTVKEKIRPMSGTHMELKLVIENELLEKLERLKNLSGKSSLIKLIESLTDKELGKRTKESPVPERVNKLARSTTPKLRRIIFQRDQEQCTWTHPETKERCEGKKYLQIDHITPFALGGETTRENLRLLCFSHNQLEARKIFGDQPKK